MQIGQVSPWVLSAFKISIGGYLTSAWSEPIAGDYLYLARCDTGPSCPSPGSGRAFCPGKSRARVNYRSLGELRRRWKTDRASLSDRQLQPRGDKSAHETGIRRTEEC